MKNIILIGFMGTGKTSTGRLLASRLGYSFIDTDYKIEQLAKLTISEMFVQYGEGYFREREAEMIRRVSRYRQAVISTGGGVVLNQENMKYLRNSGVVIALQASVNTILERTSRRQSRPLLENEDRSQAVFGLMESRRALYQKADLCIDTSDLTPRQVVEKIIDWLKKAGVVRA